MGKIMDISSEYQRKTRVSCICISESLEPMIFRNLTFFFESRIDRGNLANWRTDSMAYVGPLCKETEQFPGAHFLNLLGQLAQVWSDSVDDPTHSLPSQLAIDFMQLL